MPTPIAITIATDQMARIPIDDYNPDGTTLDPTEALSFNNGATPTYDAVIDPTDNRMVLVKGKAAGGTANLTVLAPGVTSAGVLTWAWWPSGQYTPVRPTDDGTLLISRMPSSRSTSATLCTPSRVCTSEVE